MLTVNSDSMGPNAVELEDVTKRFRSRAGERITALDPTSVEIRSGEFVSLVGPSGCGKSTLLNLAAGLMRPSGGKLKVLGEPVTGPRTDVGFMQQDPTLLPWRTVLKNVLLPFEVGNRRAPNDPVSNARALLELVGLTGFESSYPRELSGGMMQRVSLVRTLISEPHMLLMDEPFAALDAFTRETMGVELLRLWEGRGVSVVFVTHNIDEAVFLSDRILVMSPRPGRISGDIQVDLTRPRGLDIMLSDEFSEYVRQVRAIIGTHASQEESA